MFSPLGRLRKHISSVLQERRGKQRPLYRAWPQRFRQGNLCKGIRSQSALCMHVCVCVYFYVCLCERVWVHVYLYVFVCLSVCGGGVGSVFVCVCVWRVLCGVGEVERCLCGCGCAFSCLLFNEGHLHDLMMWPLSGRLFTFSAAQGPNTKHGSKHTLRRHHLSVPH